MGKGKRTDRRSTMALAIVVAALFLSPWLRHDNVWAEELGGREETDVPAVEEPVTPADRSRAPSESNDEQVAAVEAAFEEAHNLYQAGDFLASAKKLEEAYALTPSGVLAYNIAKSYDDAAEIAMAAQWYRTALADGGLSPTAENKAKKGIERNEKIAAQLAQAEEEKARLREEKSQSWQRERPLSWRLRPRIIATKASSCAGCWDQGRGARRPPWKCPPGQATSPWTCP